ncbi:hypothetical protein ABIA33_001036 [Streptacidiphilus sp. MAP12-16]|uniref:SUKH-4 family immunity protein n=1 Tax=Streptacidiphilus sp. MAP12-16 TaxID=3156300 RepID=UPI003518B039
MPQLVDRAAFESVLPVEALVTLGDEAVRGVSHAPTRGALRDIGLPDRPHARWLDVAGWICKGKLVIGVEPDEEDVDLPFAFDRWACLGFIGSTGVYVDTGSGAVYCQPEGEPPHLLNSSMDTFLYFLYLLEVERPNYDHQVAGGDIETGGAEDRLQVLMEAADPVAFENPESFWFEALRGVSGGLSGY